jgi:hypothetical protein
MTFPTKYLRGWLVQPIPKLSGPPYRNARIGAIIHATSIICPSNINQFIYLLKINIKGKIHIKANGNKTTVSEVLMTDTHKHTKVTTHTDEQTSCSNLLNCFPI